MDFRNIKRWYLFTHAVSTIEKKRPDLPHLNPSEVATLYTVFYLSQRKFVTWGNIRAARKKHKFGVNLTDLPKLLDKGVINKESRGFYTITPHGLFYLHTLEKFLRKARLDR